MEVEMSWLQHRPLEPTLDLWAGQSFWPQESVSSELGNHQIFCFRRFRKICSTTPTPRESSRSLFRHMLQSENLSSFAYFWHCKNRNKECKKRIHESMKKRRKFFPHPWTSPSTPQLLHSPPARSLPEDQGCHFLWVSGKNIHRIKQGKNKIWIKIC